MIKIPLVEYYRDKDKYSKYPDKYVLVSIKSSMTPRYQFNSQHLPPYAKKIDGEFYVIPTYISSETGIKSYLEKNDARIGNMEVFIDDLLYDIDTARGTTIQMKSSQYLELGDILFISSKQHWYNQIIIKYILDEYKSNIMHTSNSSEVKKILRELCNIENKPVSHNKLAKLYNITDLNEESVRNYILKKLNKN